jgi:predicted solute-binding protein
MWGARQGAAPGPVAQILAQARDKGVRNLPAIARREAPLLGLSEQVTIDYLTDNLYYRLGPAEREGLARFHQLAVQQKIAPEGIDLVFRHCACA